MLQFLDAGIVAAGRQFIAVLLIALTVLLVGSDNIWDPLAIGLSCGVQCIFSSRILIWACLLVALGFTLTRTRSVIITAERIRYASHLISPRYGSRTLAIQLVLSATVLTVFALQTPPRALFEAALYFGCSCAAYLMWAGITSIGVAFLGACAHAAWSTEIAPTQ
jgi:hypothetical protein